MTVKELIEELKKYDDNDNIYLDIDTKENRYSERVKDECYFIWEDEEKNDLVIEYIFNL